MKKEKNASVSTYLKIVLDMERLLSRLFSPPTIRPALNLFRKAVRYTYTSLKSL
ncbi:MAG: hypothetical protein FWG99_02685 [Treponema sp.]|nr:hypothetical protein [Treponema sp.]